MAQKRKPKVRKAAKKKARIVRALKRHAPKARLHKKPQLRATAPERARKLVAVRSLWLRIDESRRRSGSSSKTKTG